MVYKLETWAFKELPDNIKDGDSFVECDLRRFEMNTKIFEGIKDLAFIDCVYINCILPTGSMVKGGNGAIIEYEIEETPDEVEHVDV